MNEFHLSMINLKADIIIINFKAACMKKSFS